MRINKSSVMSSDTKYDVIVAIDPDVDKSGFCLYERDANTISLSNIGFPELVLENLNNLKSSTEAGKSVLVVVEAGWLNVSNWHIRRGVGARTIAETGNRTGRNQEIGRKIVEVCKYLNLEVEEQKPLIKSWKGPDRKITHEELNQVLSTYGFPPFRRTNQETRDACLILITRLRVPKDMFHRYSRAGKQYGQG